MGSKLTVKMINTVGYSLPLLEIVLAEGVDLKVLSGGRRVSGKFCQVVLVAHSVASGKPVNLFGVWISLSVSQG